MGCDIHGFVEYKYPTGDWESIAEVYIERHYALFGAMAGVRNEDIEQVAPRRGYPKDCDIFTNYEYQEWNGDAHSASWLTTEEMEKVYELVPNDEVQAIIAMMKTFKEARIVFWFDN
jgi:hypothetical protein